LRPSEMASSNFIACSLGDKFSILDSLSKASAYRTFALDKPSSYPRIALLMF
jgi:hypothetical protein